jgi:ribosomal protein L11 methyltransferase
MRPPRRARLWQVRLDLAAEAAAAIEAVEAALEAATLAVSRFERAKGRRWRFEAIMEKRPAAAFLAGIAKLAGLPRDRVHVEPLPPRDWVAQARAKLPAIRAGRFFIRGAHVRRRSPRDSIPILLEAGTAFGTGRHQTTRGCLLALDALAGRPIARPLDLGCGSGLLALAMAKLWRVPVLAADNDPAAVAVARENAAKNGVAALVRAVRSEGYAAAALKRRAPFDLVVANILADPLIALAPDLARHLMPGGRAILSGFLVEQARALTAAHRKAGLRLERRLRLGDWSVLQFRKPGRAGRRRGAAQ